MTGLALESGLARNLFDAALFTWVATEAGLRLRSAGGKTSLEWTFAVVMAYLAAGLSLGFRAAHAQPWVIAGGWAPVIAGLAVLALGAGLRICAIVTLGRPLAGMLIRIRVEEAKLTDALGQDHRDYAARTRRLIPGLW
jgi:protein-S-isoprenylcysteine O-methyltransferase Ste14